MTEPTGRPPKYKTPAEMQAKVDEYFIQQATSGKEYTWINKRGEQQTATLTPLPDWTDLAIYLGFSGRQSLNDYIGRKSRGNENKDLNLPNGENDLSFAYILTRAKGIIEVLKKRSAELGMCNERMIQLDLQANYGYVISNKSSVEVSTPEDKSIKVSFEAAGKEDKQE